MQPSEVLSSVRNWPVAHCSAVLVFGDELPNYGDEDRPYHLASLTKLLVTAAVLIAISEGAIELSDPLGPPGATVRHLLSHASGLGPQGHEIVCPPDTERIYSSVAFEIVAEYIEKSTKISFPEYLQAAICEPLGMKNTYLYGSAGYAAVSTAHDLSLFARELLDPQYIPREFLEEAFTIQYPGINGFVPGYGKHRPNPWGLGFEIHGHKNPHWLGINQPEYIVGHFGQAGTFFWCDYRLHLAAIVLTDQKFGPWAKPLWSHFNAELYASCCSALQ